MNLNDQQKQTVKKWVDEGKSVSEIQKLISSEFGVDMLYMDVRFLIDDIGAEIPSAAEQQQASSASARSLETSRRLSTPRGLCGNR